MNFTTVEIDFYHRGNRFFSTVEFSFLFFFFPFFFLPWTFNQSNGDTKNVEYIQGI